MLGSLFLTLTVAAVVSLAPASFALLRAGRHTHVAADADTSRRLRLGVAAVAAGLVGAGTAALLDAGPVVATVGAAALAGSVLAWSGRDDGSWSVRGVTVWSLVVLVLVGVPGWIGVGVLGSTSATEAVVGGVTWVVLLLAVVRLWPYLRERVAERARRQAPPEDLGERRPRPTAAAVAFLAAAGVAVALTSAAGPLGDSRPAQAERRGPGGGLTPSQAEPADSEKAPSSEDISANPTSSPTGARNGGEGSTSESPGTGEGPSSADGAPASSGPSPTPSLWEGRSADAKLPGYLKDKPNRPTKAPSPGSGNPHLP